MSSMCCAECCLVGYVYYLYFLCCYVALPHRSNVAYEQIRRLRLHSMKLRRSNVGNIKQVLGGWDSDRNMYFVAAVFNHGHKM